MSEIGFLAHRYENVSNLLEAVNHSVELLKISHYKLSGSEEITQDELMEARNFLVTVISRFIDKKQSNPFVMTGELAASLKQESDERLSNIRHRSASIFDSDEILQLSPAYIRYLRQQHKKDVRSHLKNMRMLKSDLEKAKPLTEETLQKLDQLCFDLDAEASRIFHHLRKV